MKDAKQEITTAEISEGLFQSIVADIRVRFPDINIHVVEDVPTDRFIKANGREGYLNRSVSVVPDWIEIGIYEDVEIKLLSLFHELGHCILYADPLPDCINVYTARPFHEVRCWIAGAQYASRNYPSLRFSESALHWAFSQANTYAQGVV